MEMVSIVAEVLMADADMTKLKIISRLWSHITDLMLYIKGTGSKTLEQIEAEMDVTEYHCRPYADADDADGA